MPELKKIAREGGWLEGKKGKRMYKNEESYRQTVHMMCLATAALGSVQEGVPSAPAGGGAAEKRSEQSGKDVTTSTPPS